MFDTPNAKKLSRTDRIKLDWQDYKKSKTMKIQFGILGLLIGIIWALQS